MISHRIFELDDYKAILKEIFREKKQVNSSLTFQSLAAACGVQKTYLSRVLNRDGHLNSDQLYRALNFLGAKREEREYILLVFERQRSTVEVRRQELLLKIGYFRQRAKRTEGHLEKKKKLSSDSIEYLEYYLDPNMQLVHLFLTIPSYATNCGAIANVLKMSVETLGGILEKLSALNLIAKEGTKWQVKNDRLHLPVDSPVYHKYRSMVRLRTLQKLQEEGRKDDYHFSVIFSSDPGTQLRIREKFLKFLSEIEPLVKNSASERVLQINFDLFAWG